MKKIVFFLILFYLTISPTHSEWYGGNVYNGTLNGIHSVGFSSNTGITRCPDDGQGNAGARVHPSYLDLNAGPSGVMWCQWWDEENPSSTTSRNSQSWTNNDIPVNIYTRDNGGSGLELSSYSTSGSSSDSNSNYPGGNTQNYFITYTQEGIHNLTVDMTDEVGYTETDYYGPYQIDKSIPLAPTVSSSTHPNNVWSNAPTITMGLSSNGVGPAPHQNQYCIDQTGICNPTTDMGTSISFSRPDGDHGFFARTIEPDINHLGPKTNLWIIRKDTGLPTNSAVPPNRTSWGPNSTLSIVLGSTDVAKDSVQSGLNFSRYIVNQSSGNPFGASCGGSGTSFGASTTYTNFAEGTNYIHICTEDIAGNVFSQTFGHYLVDDTLPVITNSFPNDGIWQNTNQTVSVNSTDTHSGTRFIRYTCTGIGCPAGSGSMGGGAIGANSVGGSLTFTADSVDAILTYESEDWAGNISISGSVNVKMDKILPQASGTVTYHNDWDNNTIASQRNVNFSLTDTGGSEIETVEIEVRRATLNNGSVGGFGGWGNAQTYSGLSGNSYSSGYQFPFEHGRAVQFRVLYYDEAGNQGPIITGTDTLMMDNVVPTVGDNHPAARDGVWQNTPVTVNFTGTDLHSGVAPGDFKFCETAGCDPQGGATMLGSRTFGSVTEIAFRYSAVDRAGNISPINQIDILIESIPPTATVNYHDGWDKNDGTVSRVVTYNVNDTGGSGVETVTLERQLCNATGACGGGWTPVQTSTGLNGNVFNGSFTQPFENERSYAYRVTSTDEATNIGVIGNSPSVLQMDNIDPITGATYTGTSGTWYNTPQTVVLSASDNYSGVANAQYCTRTPAGGTCDPFGGSGLPFFTSRTFSSISNLSITLGVFDNATNESTTETIDVLVENIPPTATINYHDGWDNNTVASQRNISYSVADTGGSGIENVTLERQACNAARACSGGWTAVPGHNFTGLTGNSFSRTYVQPFINERSYRYRVVYSDEATNDGLMATSTNVLQMDNVNPLSGVTYTGISGVWYNTNQTVTFLGASDNYSGVSTAMYCEVALGSICNPYTGTNMSGFRTFSSVTELSLYIGVLDNANNQSTIQRVDVLIEDVIPTGLLDYHNGRDNDTITNNRRVLYVNRDTGGSLLETVTLQRRSAPTNSTGGIGSFGGWTSVVIDGPLEQADFPGAYMQPFVNGTAVQFQVLLEDEAGNIFTVSSTDIMRMDNVIPTVTDNYVNDNIWINTSQTINFTIFDEDSGVINNPVSRRYCRGAIGNNCTPNIYLQNSLTFDPITEQTVRYQVTDRATNVSIIGSMNVLIEDIRPTGNLSYRDGRDNGGQWGVTPGESILNRTIRYDANDTGGSMLENVTLQRQTTTTNNAGGINAWPSTWIDVPGHENAGIETNDVNRTYVQPFQNGRAVRFRLVIDDEATNEVAPGGIITSPDVIMMDDVDPTVTDNYTSDGIWINTARTINFTFTDNDSGIVDTLNDASQNGSGRRYCIGALGNTCTPNVYLPNNLSFSPFSVGPLGANSSSLTPFDWEHTLRYSATDRAGNDKTTIGSIDILIEDEMPESALGYLDGRVDDTDPNSDRRVLYASTDDGGSLLERVTLQRRTAATNNDGTLGSFIGWSDIVNDPNLETAAFPGAYMQPFVNRTAHQYRVRIEDEAGNIRYSYNVGGTPTYETNPSNVPANLYTLRMENEDATAIFTNLDSNISPNGWTNVTAQGIEIDFTDTGGSLLQSYTLQVSDVIDTTATPTFPNLGTPATWANVPGYVNRAINGETDTATYTFTGVNKHAYMFRVMVTDIAGNSSVWIESTDSPIKIDTDIPEAGDVTSTTDTDLMATSVQSFVVDFDNNSGSPIIEANATFEDWSTDNTFLTTIDSSTGDNNPGVANQLDTSHSIQDVDRDREADPAGYRGYGYRITRIEDEAGNVAYVPSSTGIVTYQYRVYANSVISEIGTRDLNNVPSVTSTANIADGTTDTLIAEVRDSYENAYVRADPIGRQINFNFIPFNNLYLNQYIRSGAGSVEVRTSNTPGWIDAGLLNNSNLSDLDYAAGRDGEYDFDFRAYTPTENAYSSTTSVSDPGAEFSLSTFQFAVQHTPSNPLWDTGDQSLNNGALIDFVYAPLFTTAITGDIESFGFIEGANQDSDIEIQKANSSVNPNAESLILEFGVGERLPSPLLGLEVFSPDMDVPEGFSVTTPTIYKSFDNSAPYFVNLSAPNSVSSASFNMLDSLLTMERGTTLDEIQSSYLSTHIEYTLDGKNIKYNADIMGKDNYFGNQTGGNTIQSGLKVLGQTHSGRQKDIIIDQEGKDLRVLGDIYKASLKKDIVKNAFTIIRNAESSWTFGGANPEITDLRNFSPGTNDGKSLFNDTILYFGDDGTTDKNDLVTINVSNTTARISGQKTILAYGRDIYIEDNMYYDNNDEDILGIIALTDENGNGGNIYIDPNVTNIVGTMFAEKSVMSFDGFNELGGGTDQFTLRHQLHIYGSIFSENTIGGSRSTILACPYYVLDSDCDQDTAQKYDMNYLRRFFTYRNGTFIVPADQDNAKVIGGGTCDLLGVCTGGNSNYARMITNTDPTVDTESGEYVVHPVVIEYNPTGQTDPAPLFEAQ